jgi:phosphopantothenoylcysteine decarboxylase/phosphopantothenate--cysteine ligase
MYEHPATVAALDRLGEWGIEVIEPSAGSLACGEIGPGRLAEPDDIVADLLARLPGRHTTADQPPAPARRVLITAGGTKVPIDGVRAITNTSSGRTGATLAEQFARAGHDVTLLHAAGSALPDPANGSIRQRTFSTFDELAGALDELLPGGRFDAVIHLAAVSDYAVDHLVVDGAPATVDTSGKLDTGTSMEIHLKRTPKLLAHLKELGGDRLVVVGFKLTNGASAGDRLTAVRSISHGTDLVVHNDVTEMDDDRHVATIYRPSGAGVDVVATVADSEGLARVLERQIEALVASR